MSRDFRDIRHLDAVQRYLACVGDPSRFRLLLSLARGERCVTELAQDVGLSQSCTTRHLQAMRQAGVVMSDRRGKQVCFRLSDVAGASHPVVRWVLGTDADFDGDISARSDEIEVQRATPGTMAEGRAARRPRAIRPGNGAAAGSVAERPEHESGWVSDMAPEPAAGAGADVVAADASNFDDVPEAPRFRRDLDDFLL